MKAFIAEFTLAIQMTAVGMQMMLVPVSVWRHWSLDFIAVVVTSISVLQLWQSMIAKAHLPKEAQLQAAELSEMLEDFRKRQGQAPAQMMTVSVEEVKKPS